jgi:type III pantothenate kinase
MYAGERRVALFRLPRREGRVEGDFATHVRGKIGAVVLCSVVPAQTPALLRKLRREYGVVPTVLTAAAAHGLRIGYRDPTRLGADRLAAAIGARELFPGRNVVVVDCGTATTVTALRRDGTLAGGAIFPGLALWPEMLARRTAQLPETPLRRPRTALGRSPQEGIAAGVFFGHVGAIRETVARVRAAAFGREAALVVGTGGHAPLLAGEKLFARHEPDLVLRGLIAFAGQTADLPEAGGGD